MINSYMNKVTQPTSGTPSLETLEALHRLIETRHLEISRSEHVVGKTRVHPENDLLFFQKHEAPLVGEIFMHPVRRKMCAVLKIVSQAGRDCLTFQEFDTTVGMFTTRSEFDRERQKLFVKLQATNHTNIPCSLIAGNTEAIFPLSYRPELYEVFLFNNHTYYRILSSQPQETFFLCRIEELVI